MYFSILTKTLPNIPSQKRPGGWNVAQQPAWHSLAELLVRPIGVGHRLCVLGMAGAALTFVGEGGEDKFCGEFMNDYEQVKAMI